MKRTRLSAEQARERALVIHDMWKSGLKLREIAESLGINVSLVGYYLTDPRCRAKATT